jgi:Flp pilus assembly pilin Flp
VLELLRQWIREEHGQDLLEYALLSSFIGFSCVAAVDLLANAMSTTYTSWDTAVQSDALVEVPDPVPVLEP